MNGYGRLTIGTTACSTGGAWIYIAGDLQLGIAYVGQTSDKRGVLGRWIGHLTDDTAGFRRRVRDWDETAWTSIRPVVVFWSLGNAPAFTGVESSLREAVEYLVQTGLRSTSRRPPFTLISRVRTNPAVHIPAVRRHAERILRDFEANYPVLLT